MIETEPLLSAGFLATLCVLCGSVAFIDFRYGIIPDRLNLAIAAVGLIKSVFADGAIIGIETALASVVVGITFWLLRRLYFTLRNIQGLGLGDVKFLAAATPWVGITGIPVLLLIAALTALIAIGGAQLAGQNVTRQTMLPFGPFLAAGLLLALAAQQALGLV